MTQGEGEQVQRADADHRHPQRLGHRLARGQSHSHTGEQAGPDVDRDGTELVDVDVGLPADEFDRRYEGLGVAPPAADLEHRQYALVPADGDAHLLGGGLDPEYQHLFSSDVMSW